MMAWSKRSLFRLAFAFALSFGVFHAASAQDQAATTEEEIEAEIGPDLDNRLYMDLEDGRVVIDLRPDLAPNHVERIKLLARQNFYDGIVFHRVIDGFMAQTGDPTGTGMGGSDLPDLDAEFPKLNKQRQFDDKFVRGVLGMARSQDPNSANSQFFIMYADGPWLDGKYTIIGSVVEGMELLDRLKKGSKAQNGLVKDPDAMKTLRVAIDIEAPAEQTQTE